ncbi:phage holin family protein [Gardnerella leopoldii]|uniref:phage holin family protein n=1 Tax=Gardnerella leopoldii TaxID=2792978 RepID=UPI0039EE5B57
MTKPEVVTIGLTAILIVLDYVTGLMKAFATRTVSSSKMRAGLYHKAGYAVVIALAFLLEHGQQYVNLGFTVPLIAPVCLYIVFAEIVSVLENAVALNPELVHSGIFKVFLNSNDALKDEAQAQAGKHAAILGDGVEPTNRSINPGNTPTENK